MKDIKKEKFKLTPIKEEDKWIFITFAEEREKRLRKLKEDD